MILDAIAIVLTKQRLARASVSAPAIGIANNIFYTYLLSHTNDSEDKWGYRTAQSRSLDPLFLFTVSRYTDAAIIDYVTEHCIFDRFSIACQQNMHVF